MAEMNVEQQIVQQRSQIEQSRKQLEEQRRKSTQVSQEQLRGVERGKRQVKDALTQRAERKAGKELVGKAIGQVSEFETEFETEIASKVPQYAKEKFVEEEFKKATSKIQDKISNVQSQIEFKRQRRLEALSKNDFEKADSIEDEISYLDARIGGYQKALQGDKVNVIQNVNTGYAEELASYEESKAYNRKQELEQIKSLGFKTRTEYIKAKPILEKLSKEGLTDLELLKLPSKIRESVSIIEVPSQVMTMETSPSKVESNVGVYENIFTGARVSSISGMGKGWVEVNPITYKLFLDSNKNIITKNNLKQEIFLASSTVTPKNIIQKVVPTISGVLTTPFISTTGGLGFRDTLQSAGETGTEFFTKAPLLYGERIEIEKKIGKYQEDVSKINELVKQQEDLNKQYESGEIEYESYESKFSKIEDKIKNISGGDFFKKVEERGGITTIPQLTSEKDAPEWKKRLATGLLFGSKSASYFTPLRFAYGSEYIGSGLERLEKGQIGGIKDVAVGTLFVLPYKSRGGTGTAVKEVSKLRTKLKIGGAVTLIGASSTLEGYSVARQTGDIGLGVSAGIGSAVGFGLGITSFALDRKIGMTKFEKQRLNLQKKLPEIQRGLARDQSRINRLELERYKIFRGETGRSKVTPRDITIGTKISAKQKTALIKYYKDIGVAKTDAQALKIISDSRVGKVTFETGLFPELSKDTQALFYSKREFGVISSGVKTGAGSKEIAFVSPILKSGKMSTKGEIQIITTTKGDKFSTITQLEPFKRVRELKVSGQPSIQIVEVGYKKSPPTIVKTKLIGTEKIGDNIILRRTQAEFRELKPFGRRTFVDSTELFKQIKRQTSVSQSKKLFTQSTPVSKDIIKEIILKREKTPFNVNVQSFIGDKSLGFGVVGTSKGTTQKYSQLTFTNVGGVSPITRRFPKVVKIVQGRTSTTTTKTTGTTQIQMLEQELVSKTKLSPVLPKTIKTTSSKIDTKSVTTGLELKAKDLVITTIPLVEKSDVTVSRIGFETPITSDIIGKTTLNQITSSERISIQEIPSKLESKQLPMLQTSLTTKQAISPIIKTITIQRPLTKVSQISQVKQLTQLSTKQVQRTTLIQKETTKPKQPIKLTPKKTPTPIPIGLGKAVSKAKKIMEEDGFEVFVTKGGKDVSLGEAGTQLEAERLLKSKLVSTLRAGGFIQKVGGRKLKATELKTFGGGEFRLSKASPFKIIERKERRIKRGSGETREIQSFRSGKKRLKRNKFL